jgi:cytochrome b561
VLVLPSGIEPSDDPLLSARSAAYLLFALFLVHLGAALLHGLIRRDGVFESMASWGRRKD